MIHFTSDLHFCHQNIIRLCERPFAGIEDMHEALISNWNAIVQPNDDVYVLGDFAFRGKAAQVNSILQRLAGKKYLIRGNHDQFLESIEFDTSQFEWVKDYHVLNYHKRRFILFHYPIWEWADYFRDSIHLFGHVHYDKKAHEIERARSGEKSCCFSVCTDVCNFTPVSIEAIIAAADNFDQFEGFNR